jgi:hypothetical protein
VLIQRPTRDKLRRDAERFAWCSSQTKPQPGETCLVAVSPERVSLWCLRHGPYRYETDAVPFVGRAAEALSYAQGIAMRDLPMLLKLEPQLTSWFASLIYKDGANPDYSLDGASFGLSMCLAMASRMLGEPIPVRFAASARVKRDGSVHPVSELERKLQMIEESALMVDIFLVCKDQEKDASAILEKLQRERPPQQTNTLMKARRPLQVVGVSTVQEALSLVWPALESSFLERWTSEPQAARRAADDIFYLALDGSPQVIQWQGVIRAAEILAQVPGLDESSQERAHLAAQIAKRHQDHNNQILFPKVLTRWPLPLRMKLLAHVMQSATDTDTERTRDYLSRIEEQFLSKLAHEMSGEELRLLGAAGRGHAALGNFERSRELSLSALRAWVALQEWEQATFPLSEYLRLLGILQQREELFEALSLYVDELSRSQCSNNGLGFVYLAAGRALCQMNEPERAMLYLEHREIDWRLVSPHLRRACWRWQWVALLALRREAEARELREKLQAKHDAYWCLLRLEESSTEAAQEVSALVNSTKEVWGSEFLRTFQRLECTPESATREQIETFLREYRY